MFIEEWKVGRYVLIMVLLMKESAVVGGGGREECFDVADLVLDEVEDKAGKWR
jgi:hypothetical protein